LGEKVTHAQRNAYEKAFWKFTGEHKYDIEKSGTLEEVQAPDFLR